MTLPDQAIRDLLGIQYGRDDVEYQTWYGDWAKELARTMSLPDIERELGVAQAAVAHASRVHLRAVDATHSITGQSQRRAQSRNVVAAAGARRMALSGAREIHYLFPEHAKRGSQP